MNLLNEYIADFSDLNIQKKNDFMLSNEYIKDIIIQTSSPREWTTYISVLVYACKLLGITISCQTSKM